MQENEGRPKMKKVLIILAMLVVSVVLINYILKGPSPESVALHNAASNRKRTADVESMLAKGVDVDSKDKTGRTPLYNAAGLGHKETVEILIANGADVNTKDDSGETPLHAAAQSGMPDIAILLLDAGADVNAKTKEGETPLDYVNRYINKLKQMENARPVEGAGKRIASFALEQMPSLLQRYELCAKVLLEHGAK